MNLQSAIGSISLGEVFLTFAILTPFYLAIAWHSIRKRQKASARFDGGKLVVKWALVYFVISIIFAASSWGAARPEPVSLVAILIGVIVPGAIIIAIILTPYISNLMASPITNAIEGRLDQHWEKPAYGPTMTARNRGDYEGALEQVDLLLEKHPGDFEGLMLKASIEAEDYLDLGTARGTLDEILNNEERLRYNLPIVYNKLADWQMNLFDDPEGARRSLEVIRKTYPESKAAQLASQRLASMDSFDEASSEASDIDETYQQLAAESAEKDQLKGPLDIPTASEEDTLLTNETAFAQCINRVEEHPDSITNREELAALYVSHANEPVLAIQQYEYLLGMPGATEKQQVAWLNKVADIQVKSGGTHEEARATLQRVIDINPEGAGATRAQSRIMRLSIEIRAANKKNAPLKLERREEDLGLM